MRPDIGALALIATCSDSLAPTFPDGNRPVHAYMSTQARCAGPKALSGGSRTGERPRGFPLAAGRPTAEGPRCRLIIPYEPATLSPGSASRHLQTRLGCVASRRR